MAEKTVILCYEIPKNTNNNNNNKDDDDDDDDSEDLNIFKKHQRHRGDRVRKASYDLHQATFPLNMRNRAASDSSITSSSSSMKITYSVNSQSEYGFTLRSIEKSNKSLNYVQKMKLKFEKLCEDKQFIQSPKFDSGIYAWTNPADFNITEVPSADEAEDIPEYEINEDHRVVKFKSEQNTPDNSCSSDGGDDDADNKDQLTREHHPRKHGTGMLVIPNITVDEIKENEKIIDATNIDSSCPTDISYLRDCGDRGDIANSRRSEPLPRRKVCQTENRNLVKKMYSYHSPTEKKREHYSDSESFDSDFDPNDIVDPPKRQPITTENNNISKILQELIATEEKYVENLKAGIQNYMTIFLDRNLPALLKGKKYVIFGNIEQIADFHEYEFLPMLQRNRNDLEQLCNEFSKYIEDNRFYKYVLYAINKSKSEKLCIQQKEFFYKLQTEVDDKLGINSFLVQPIQRLPRYGLLLDGMIHKLFTTDPVKHKAVFPACCKAEKNLRNLVQMVNEAMQINDIEECDSMNILYQGRFKKCDEFTIYDYDLRRTYRSKVFIFQRCLVYTEIIKDKRLIMRGYYPCERIGFLAGKKSFTLYNQYRKTQECDFSGETEILNSWIKLITDMISTFVENEKKKLKQKYAKNDNIYRRPGSIFLLRNSSRISSDSGIASMFGTQSSLSNENSPRTTWYADNFTS